MNKLPPNIVLESSLFVVVMPVRMLFSFSPFVAPSRLVSIFFSQNKTKQNRKINKINK